MSIKIYVKYVKNNRDFHTTKLNLPTGNLDEDTAREIIELIKKTAHELGKCVIVVTHSKQLAEEADVVLAINQGVLHEQECLKENLLEKL